MRQLGLEGPDAMLDELLATGDGDDDAAASDDVAAAAAAGRADPAPEYWPVTTRAVFFDTPWSDVGNAASALGGRGEQTVCARMLASRPWRLAGLQLGEVCRRMRCGDSPAYEVWWCPPQRMSPRKPLPDLKH